MQTTDEPLRDANKRKYFYCKDKATGSLVALSREKDFSAKLYDRLEEAKVDIKPASEVAAPSELALQAIEFAKLASKSYRDLSGDERKRYAELKALFADPEDEKSITSLNNEQ